MPQQASAMAVLVFTVGPGRYSRVSSAEPLSQPASTVRPTPATAMLTAIATGSLRKYGVTSPLETYCLSFSLTGVLFGSSGSGLMGASFWRCSIWLTRGSSVFTAVSSAFRCWSTLPESIWNTS
jgi:hypothetical protein